jgi:multidrug efflux pump subunit AcrA (membrane-fusion protein)
MFVSLKGDSKMLTRSARPLGRSINECLCVLLLGLSAVSCTSSGQAKIETKRSIRAQTENLRLVTVTDHFQAPGTIRAKTQTVLSSKLPGQIVSVRVREGDRVRQGDLIVELEGRDITAQSHRAQAAQGEASHAMEEVEAAIRAADAAAHAAEVNRDLALRTRQRYEVLRERHSISPQEFDEVDARYNAASSDVDRARASLNSALARRSQVAARIQGADAEVESAQVALGYLKITSPINGVITARQAEPGMLATPGMPLLAIDDDQSYQLHSIVEESHAGSIRIGEQVPVQFDNLAATVDSRVSGIVPASDPATRTYVVKLDLALAPASRSVVHSGFFGRALFPAGDRQALLVPASALVHRGQLTGVYVVENNAALLRLVKIGKRYEQGIEILSGINEGVRILTAPPSEMSDGVMIVEQSPEGTAP